MTIKCNWWTCHHGLILVPSIGLPWTVIGTQYLRPIALAATSSCEVRFPYYNVSHGSSHSSPISKCKWLAFDVELVMLCSTPFGFFFFSVYVLIYLFLVLTKHLYKHALNSQAILPCVGRSVKQNRICGYRQALADISKHLGGQARICMDLEVCDDIFDTKKGCAIFIERKKNLLSCCWLSHVAGVRATGIWSAWD